MKQAKVAVERWLALRDCGQFAETWSELAPLAQKADTKKEWVASLTRASNGLGKVTSRKWLKATYATTLPGAPDGEYVIFKFQTTYKNKEDTTTKVTETIASMKCKDGKWRVSYYHGN